MIESSELIEKIVKNKAFDPMPMGGEVNSTLIARRAAEYALAKLQTAVQWERLEE
jgi:monomeric isocitrate dehydrogenase